MNGTKRVVVTACMRNHHLACGKQPLRLSEIRRSRAKVFQIGIKWSCASKEMHGDESEKLVTLQWFCFGIGLSTYTLTSICQWAYFDWI
jgi:hypothetical protein